MRRFILVISFFLSTIIIYGRSGTEIDSVLYKTMESAENYCKLIEKYDADIYMRTYSLTLRKNILHKYLNQIPNFVLYDSKHSDALIETYSQVHYKYPNIYKCEVNNVNGTMTSKKDILMLPFNMLNINVYSVVTNDDRFFMPIRFKTKKYYKYWLTDSIVLHGTKYYNIRFFPSFNSSKLLKGNFTVEDKTWRVTSFNGIGIDIFMDFSIALKMGTDSLEKYLPVEFKISRTHFFLGNKIRNQYLAKVRYSDIALRKNDIIPPNYNIQNTYSLRLDSTLNTVEDSFWKDRDSLTINSGEKKLFDKLAKERNVMTDSVAARKTLQVLTQTLIGNTKYHYKKTEINYSGFLNPFMLEYSTQNGVKYKLNLSFKTELNRDKSVSVALSGAYASKYRDLVADLSTSLNYAPSHFGYLTLSVGKGNRSFSSNFIKQMQDSLSIIGSGFSDLFANYYVDNYLRLYINNELFNGFQLKAGAEYHIRNASQNNDRDIFNPPADEIENIRHYVAPTMRITWTPGQYYRMEGYKKIYAYSKYPTFTIEYSYGIPVFINGITEYSGATRKYDRFEFDASQRITVGLLKTLQYHGGLGFYYRTDNDYFADFSNFSRSFIPQNWDDGIGGVFNMLPYDAYNAADRYMQFHLMYETPFLLMSLFPRLSLGVLKERLYFSQLSTPFMPSYSEIGYGLGNKFINAAVFGSFNKITFYKIGAKVVFLL